MKKLFYLAIAAIGMMTLATACSSDGDGNKQTYEVSIEINYPALVSEGTYSDVVFSVKDISSAETYTAAYTEAGANKYTLSLRQGLYEITFSATLAYNDAGTTTEVSHAVKGLAQNVAVTGAITVPAIDAFFSSDNTAGFVIKEVYYGSLTSDSKTYFYDQYIAICNNSDQTLYADGLLLCESKFKTVTKYDYYGYDQTVIGSHLTDFMDCDAIYQIPGNGTDYPVAAGATIILANQAQDHTTLNTASSPDMSSANFEWYDETTNNIDIDNPAVPNLTRIACYTDTVWNLNSLGTSVYFLARFPDGFDATHFATDYTFNPKYMFISATIEKEMTVAKCWRVPIYWISEAVNFSQAATYAWLLTPSSLDMGYVTCSSVVAERMGTAYKRKASGSKLQDTNNSADDFETGASSYKK